MNNVKALREALDPFARAARIIDGIRPDLPDDAPARDHLPGIWPTIGDLRRANELLKKSERG